MFASFSQRVVGHPLLDVHQAAAPCLVCRFYTNSNGNLSTIGKKTHWVSCTTNAYSIHRSCGVEAGKGSRVDEADAGAPPLIRVDAEAATPPHLGLANAGAGSRVMSLFTRAA